MRKTLAAYRLFMEVVEFYRKDYPNDKIGQDAPGCISFTCKEEIGDFVVRRECIIQIEAKE